MTLMSMETHERVRQLLNSRTEVLRKLLVVTGAADNHRLGVTFGGTYQDEATVNLIRPVLVRQLLRDLEAVHNKIRAQGVEPDPISEKLKHAIQLIGEGDV